MRDTVVVMLTLHLVGAVLLVGSPAHGAASFSLTISPSNINFPDSDPDSFPTVQSSGVNVAVNPSGFGASTTWYLHGLARGNLVSASSSIQISNVSWTTTNQPIFKDGTMTTSVPGTLVAQNVGGTAVSATLTFSLQNLWTYSTGTYLQTLDFTATAP